MNIAWRAEAHALAERGVVYIAFAPLVQQLAAMRFLAARGLSLRDGKTAIVDPSSRITPVWFASLKDETFNCHELKPASAGQARRSVILTCGFNATDAAQYLRQAAAISKENPDRDPDAEGGFIGLSGLDEASELALLSRLPREPLPASDFLAMMARAVESLEAG